MAITVIPDDRNVGITVFASDEAVDPSFPTGRFLYLFVYIDPEGNYSDIKLSRVVTTFIYDTIVFSFAPGIYSKEIDRMEIYRSGTLVPVNSGDIAEGVKYYVFDGNPDSQDALIYDGTSYYDGDTFIGVAGEDTYDDSSNPTQLFVFPYPLDFGYIGKVESEDEGVFFDDYINPGKVFRSHGGEYNYESGIRWSEPYRPNHIRLENLNSFRFGDGKQITGLGVVYGNLIVFKETSMGRYAVQAQNPPISRVDEISSEIGCISPNTLVQVDNTLYFLSWHGFYKYDNNSLQKFDAKFSEELQFRISQLKESALHTIRKASCGYNSKNDEIWINIPFTGEDEGNSSYSGTTSYFERSRTLRGHIYVISLNAGYATKFAYANFIGTGTLPAEEPDPATGEVIPRPAFSHARIYHKNSLGELRSAETGHHFECWPYTPPDPPPTMAHIPAGIFIDSPSDEEYESVLYVTDYIDENNNIIPIEELSYVSTLPTITYNLWRSKHFTAAKEHNIKRLRKASFNRWQKDGDGVITVNSAPFDQVDDRIDEDGFISTQTYASGSNVITIIPTTVERSDEDEEWFIDDYGKPIRCWIQYEGQLRTHINAVSFWWRPIHRYTP